MHHLRAEVFWQIPHRQDRQDEKSPTNAQGDKHACNWLSYYASTVYLRYNEEPSDWQN